MTDSTCKIDEYGAKRWYNDKGEYHRENDLPAIEWTNGDKFWYLNGKHHRDNGPAIEYADGDKFWYLNDKLHRENGPAYESANGYKSWYVDDERVDCEDNDTFLRMMKFKWCW